MSEPDGVEPAPLIGGRYALGELIGRGGAADVFQARDELLGREVAIKMFNPGTEVEPGSVGTGAGPSGSAGAPGPDPVGDLEGGQESRHRREVLTLAGLSHPGLVTVYDVGDEEGRAYFVMQLIEGATLGQRIRGGPLAVVDVIALGAALADALAYVHRRGVVHRDVKPGNVLLDGDGRAHLSDFGIAAVRDAAPVTAAGMVIGTASYLSPEQVRGEPVEPAVDVYALGLVLIECLTGRREYPGQALEAAVARLHRRPVVPPRLPEGLGALLAAMTADDPAERPGAADVVVALREVSRTMGMDAETVLSPMLAAAPVTTAIGAAGAVGPATEARAFGVADRGVADPVPTGASPAARPRRRRAAVVVGIAAAAVVVAGSALSYALVSSPDAAPPPVPAASGAPPMPVVPPVLAAPTTTTEAERATATRSSRTATTRSTTPRTTTTIPPSPVPVPPPAVETPPSSAVTTPPTAPPTRTTTAGPTRRSPNNLTA